MTELSTSPEIQHSEEPLDYSRAVAGSEPVVFLGENHAYEGSFWDLAAHAQELKDGGIEAVLLEAPNDQDFTALNAGDFSGIDNLNLGISLEVLYAQRMHPALQQEIATHGDGVAAARKAMIKAFVQAGIPVAPIDDPDYWRDLNGPSYPSVEQHYQINTRREQILQQGMLDGVETYGRVAVLIGKAKTIPRIGEFGQRPDLPYRNPAQQLVDKGIPIRSINLNTSTPTVPQGENLQPGGVVELERAMYKENGVIRVLVPQSPQEMRIQLLLNNPGVVL